MRLSVIKDKVIYALVNGGTLKGLAIDGFSIQAALVELSKEDYITIIETSVTGSGNIRTYEFQSLLPKAKHFVDTKQSFRKEELKQWVIDFPKRYWILWVAATLLTAFRSDILEFFLRLIQPGKK